jgi:hypothetical protein
MRTHSGQLDVRGGLLEGVGKASFFSFYLLKMNMFLVMV